MTTPTHVLAASDGAILPVVSTSLTAGNALHVQVRLHDGRFLWLAPHEFTAVEIFTHDEFKPGTVRYFMRAIDAGFGGCDDDELYAFRPLENA